MKSECGTNICVKCTHHHEVDEHGRVGHICLNNKYQLEYETNPVTGEQALNGNGVGFRPYCFTVNVRGFCEGFNELIVED